jgi:arylsulfatase A-like enzyme
VSHDLHKGENQMRAFPFLLLSFCASGHLFGQAPRPNIVLVMADDQGWGQVGYNGHPKLKTPHLDAMAESGIRFDRFYAAGPVCSPTRASVLTGRSPKRTGVPSHGHNLCLQEKTLPAALRKAGYTTAHFGKWHLNGVRGPGVPVLGDDANHPGRYGFDEWLSVTNFFDLDPLLSRNGKFEDFGGDSSDVVVTEALRFMARQEATQAPFLAVIWYGSPHNPMRAMPEDLKDLPDDKLGHHLGELVGIDRSVGTLRRGLRDLGIERNTLVWYCSDNGGLDIDPYSCGNLRGHKGQVFEGGIRVPGIVEWPGHIRPMITDFPASTMDIMPTIVDLLDLPDDSQLAVRDGESLVALFDGDTPHRKRPIPFYFQKKMALVDGDYKLLSTNIGKDEEWELYDLKNDPIETEDLSGNLPERFQQMKSRAKAMIASIDASALGEDYPEGRILQPARSAFWHTMKEYQPHFEMFFKRPEYSGSEKKVPEALRTGRP